MGTRRHLTVALAALILAAGCGSSGHRPSTAAPASPPRTGIRAQVLANNELAGFTEADVNVYSTPSGWISPEQNTPAALSAEKAMLKREGFRIGVHEDLVQGSLPGLSTVQRFRSAAAARSALTFYVSQTKAAGASAGAYAPFKVPGIPGAVGFTLGGPGGGSNIAFSDGADYYLLGREGASRADVAGLVAAARHLYHRVPR